MIPDCFEGSIFNYPLDAATVDRDTGAPILVGSRRCRYVRMYMTHGEVGPPAAQWWETKSGWLGFARVQKGSQKGGDRDRDPTMYKCPRKQHLDHELAIIVRWLCPIPCSLTTISGADLQPKPCNSGRRCQHARRFACLHNWLCATCTCVPPCHTLYMPPPLHACAYTATLLSVLHSVLPP